MIKSDLGFIIDTVNTEKNIGHHIRNLAADFDGVTIRSSTTQITLKSNTVILAYYNIGYYTGYKILKT